MVKNNFYKKDKNDIIWWVEQYDDETMEIVTPKGEHLFSFDQTTVYNLFADYPHNLTIEQRQIFDRENPCWKDFFKDRK